MTDTTGPGRPSEIVPCPNCGKRNRVPAAVARGVPRCGNCRKPLPWLTTALDHDFDEVAGKASVPVLVDLWAPGAGRAAYDRARGRAGRSEAGREAEGREGQRRRCARVAALLAWVRDAIGEGSEPAATG
jgi:hypothetical protein